MFRPRTRHLLFCAPLLLIGCTEKTAEIKDQTEIKTPDGTRKVERTTKVETSGSQPPGGPAGSETHPSPTSTP